MAHRQVQEVAVELQDLILRNAGAIPRRSHMADDLEAALVGASAQPLGDGRRAGAGAPHEHAALENILVDDAQKREPGERQAGKSEYPGETENAASHEERRCQIENQAQGAFGHQHRNQQAGHDACESRALPQLI